VNAHDLSTLVRTNVTYGGLSRRIEQQTLFTDAEILPWCGESLEALVAAEEQRDRLLEIEDAQWERRGEFWVRRDPAPFTPAYLKASPSTLRALEGRLPIKELPR
jgi:hypothetical protein